MFGSIFDDIKREFRYGNMVTRLVIVNGAFFLAINLVWLLMGWSEGWYNWISHGLMLSTNWFHNLTHPWVFITHMFLHEMFWHLLWNMLILYWFGRIVGDFIGNHRVLPIYLLGGFAGALTYFLIYGGLLGAEGYALGASASVMALVLAAGALSPDYLLNLILIGEVKLKYVVGVIVLLDLIGVANGNNTGGHIAHLGGAFMGWLFVSQLRKGNDLAIPLNGVIDWFLGIFNSFFGKRSNLRVEKNEGWQGQKTKSWNQKKSKGATEDSHQERIDAILDKIRESGYDSLTTEEKEFLFNASKK